MGIPYDDKIPEPTETVTIDLQPGSLYALGSPTRGTVNITDNDIPWQVRIDAPDNSAYEPTSPPPGKGDPGQFRVTRTGGSNLDVPLTVYYTIGGEALNGTDYTGANGDPIPRSVTIQANQAEAYIDINPLYDTLVEGDENVTLTLAADEGYSPNLARYTIGSPSSATVTIHEQEPDSPRHCCFLTGCPTEGRVEILGNDSDGSAVLCFSGGLSGDPELANLMRFGYMTSANSHPSVSADVKLQPTNGLATLDKVEASLSFGGVAAGTLWYNGTGAVQNEVYRFALPADTSTLMPSRYDWGMTITQHYSDGSTVSDTYYGQKDVLNMSQSTVGSGWGIKALARLMPNANGVSLIHGGDMYFFLSSGPNVYRSGADVEGEMTLTGNWTSGFTLSYNDGTTESFNAQGVLTSRRDRNNNAIQFSYIDANGDGRTDEVSQITTPSGQSMTLAYTSGLLSSVTDFSGRVLQFAHNASGQLTSITEPDPDGAGPLTSPVWLFGYSPTTGAMTSMTNPANKTTSFAYDFAGTLQTITYADTKTEGLRAVQTRALVDTSTGVGTQANPALLVRPVAASGTRTDELNHTTSFTVDRFGFRTSETDALGKITTYERNQRGQVTKMTEPDPDDGGPLTSPITTYTYDAKGNLTDMVLPDSSTRHWTYDATFSQVTSYTDELGHRTLYDIDPANGNVRSERRVVGLVDGQGNTETDDVVTSYTYTTAGTPGVNPPAGLVSTMTDALGRVTRYQYNARGQVTQITYAEGTADQASIQNEYDPVKGDLTATIDELGNRTVYGRDSLGRVTSVTLPDPDGTGPLASPVTSYKYDGMNRVTQETTPLSRVNDYAYTNRGQLNYVLRPDHDGDGARQFDYYSYNADGSLFWQSDLAGRVTYYYYDVLGRLTSRYDPDPDGSGPQGYPVTQYAYDNLGRTTSVTDPLSHVTTYAYENFGRRVTQTDPDPDGAGPLTSPVTVSEYDAAGNLLSVTDPLNRVTSYQYDALGRLWKVTQPDPDGAGPLTSPVTEYRYDKMGNLRYVIDPLGNTTEYRYDNRDRLVRTILPDPDGTGPLLSPETSSTYDAAGHVLTETDALGNVTSYEYDHLGRRTKMTQPDPDGAGPVTAPVTQYAYDAENNLTSVTDPLGNVTSYGYDALNHRTSVTQPDPDGAGPLTSPITSYAYNAAGDLLRETDPRGSVTTYGYDGAGRVISVTQPDPDGTGPLTAPVTQYTYDLGGRLAYTTDALSRITSYSYDNLDRQISVTRLADPDGAGPLTSQVTSYSYDKVGNLLSETDPLGNVTSYEYDGLNRRTRMTLPDPDGAGSLTSPVTNYTYDRVGNLLTETDARSQVTSYLYDNLYRRTRVTRPDPDGAGYQTAPVTNYAYNAAGQLTSMTDALGYVTSYEYDHLGRQTKVIEPDPDGAGPALSPFTLTTYDKVGSVLSTENALGERTSYGYDNLYRKTSETDPRSGITRYTYDPAGNMLTLVDSVNNTTTWTYDKLNRATQETNQLGLSRLFEYDAIGKLTKRTDRNGRVIEYGYDNLDRKTQEVWKDGTTTVRTIASGYDGDDRLTSLSDPTSTISYTLDNLGRATWVNQTIAGFTPTIAISQAFDEMSNRTSLYAYLGGNFNTYQTYGYDYLNRLSDSVMQTGPGNSVAVKYGMFTYDGLDRLTGIYRMDYTTATGWTTVANSSYGYDNASRLTSLSHTKGATTLASYAWAYDRASRPTSFTSSADGSVTYTHDTAGQLTGADYNYQTDEGYSYDANGNRTNTGYNTTSNNRLQSDGTYTYEYDNEGNRTRRTKISDGAVTEYAWDHRNRLVTVTEKASLGGAATKTTSYSYDPLNRLVKKTTDPDGAGAQAARDEFFAFDGDQVLLRFTGSEANNLSNRYLWGPAIDQYLADEQITAPGTAGTVYWGLTDNLGTVRDVITHNPTTDVTTVVNHRRYDSFGNLTAETNAAVDLLFGYTGRMFDEDTGLQNNLNRWYDPKVGRWLSEDPIGFEAGDENLYRYCGNGTTTATDPDGLWGRDIHYDLTKAIAEYVGISCPDEIAAGAQRPDEDSRNPTNLQAMLDRLPGIVAKLPMAERSARIREAAKQIAEMLKYHFPMDAKGVVVPGGTEAYDLVAKGIGGFREGGGRCDFKLFTEGLHPLQDSFSHGGGKPSFGPFGGHATGVLSVPNLFRTLSNILQGNFKVEKAQVQLRGLLAGLSHSADDPKARPKEFREMAAATFKQMNNFAKLCGKCGCPESKGAASPKGPIQHTDSDFDMWLKNWYRAKYNVEPKW